MSFWQAARIGAGVAFGWTLMNGVINGCAKGVLKEMQKVEKDG